MAEAPWKSRSTAAAQISVGITTGKVSAANSNTAVASDALSCHRCRSKLRRSTFQKYSLSFIKTLSDGL